MEVPSPPRSRVLRIEGARQNNLKNVTLDIPHDRLTVITGVSGSGKSSLAFDTLFAEGQWRYIESLSTYARMFLERVDRPDVDRIVNVRPAVALEQKNPVRTARSTVAPSRTPKITRSTTSSVSACIRGASGIASPRGQRAMCSWAIAATMSW